MTAELERAPIVDRLGSLPLVVYDRLRTNLAQSGAFLARRRRGLRFRVIPYDFVLILNAAVVVASLLAAIAFVLDPLLLAWQQSLPEPTVTFFQHVTRFGKSDWILIGTGVFLIVDAEPRCRLADKRMCGQEGRRARSPPSMCSHRSRAPGSSPTSPNT